MSQISDDYKFKVGEIYWNPARDFYWMCTYICKDKDGSIHYGGRSSALGRPSYMETVLGLGADGDGYDFGDGIKICFDHIYNYTRNGEDFELCREDEIQSLELVKKLSYDDVLAYRRAENVWEAENKE